MIGIRSPRAMLVPVVVAIGLGAGMLLAGCSAPGSAPSASATGSRTATRSASAEPSSAPSASASGGTATGTGTGTGTGASTGSSSGGTSGGSGSGDGSSAGDDGTSTGPTVDLAAMDTQAVAAAGGGTVVQATGSGDAWTILVSASDGSQTLAVVSATSMRVTSGPFPKSTDAATQASTLARIARLGVDAAHAAATGVGAFGGSSLTSVQLAGTDASPQWSVGVTVGGTKHTVTIDGASGTVVASD